MGDRARGPEEYLPLTPAVLDILVALGGEELHGYAIMREVRRRTDGRRRLAPGTLYRSLRQMQEKGLVEESEERPDADLDDERRRYYRLTDLGRKVAVAEVEGRGGGGRKSAPTPTSTTGGRATTGSRILAGRSPSPRSSGSKDWSVRRVRRAW